MTESASQQNSAYVLALSVLYARYRIQQYRTEPRDIRAVISVLFPFCSSRPPCKLSKSRWTTFRKLSSHWILYHPLVRLSRWVSSLPKLQRWYVNTPFQTQAVLQTVQRLVNYVPPAAVLSVSCAQPSAELGFCSKFMLQLTSVRTESIYSIVPQH